MLSSYAPRKLPPKRQEISIKDALNAYFSIRPAREGLSIYRPFFDIKLQYMSKRYYPNTGGGKPR